ncbi:MAG: hypothetical protein R2731_02510 [Nocardioides sp.]
MKATTAGRLSLGILAIAVGVTAVALRGAVPLSVLGLAVLGVPHLVLELRYVIGRFAAQVAGPAGMLLFVLLSSVVVARAVVALLSSEARWGEVLTGHAVVAAGAVLWLHGRARLLVLLGLAASVLIGLTDTPAYFVVLTHLHNLVPSPSCGTGPAASPTPDSGRCSAACSWSGGGDPGADPGRGPRLGADPRGRPRRLAGR